MPVACTTYRQTGCSFLTRQLQATRRTSRSRGWRRWSFKCFWHGNVRRCASKCNPQSSHRNPCVLSDPLVHELAHILMRRSTHPPRDIVSQHAGYYRGLHCLRTSFRVVYNLQTESVEMGRALACDPWLETSNEHQNAISLLVYRYVNVIILIHKKGKPIKWKHMYRFRNAFMGNFIPSNVSNVVVVVTHLNI